VLHFDECPGVDDVYGYDPSPAAPPGDVPSPAQIACMRSLTVGSQVQVQVTVSRNSLNRVNGYHVTRIGPCDPERFTGALIGRPNQAFCSWM
jgi:hypothetical protein